MKFTVPGIPVAKARPRFARVGQHVRTFTPKETAAFEDRVRLFAVAAGVRVIEGPVALTVRAWWPMVGTPRKREPRPERWKTAKPDADNAGKAAMDALNGIAFRDDAQVARLLVEKRHCAQDDPAGARVEIEVAPLAVYEPEE